MKWFVCIVIFGLFSFAYIEVQNRLTKLRLTLPNLAKEVDELHKENIALRYTLDRFESPLHLMETLRKPEYGHLKYPTSDEVREL